MEVELSNFRKSQNNSDLEKNEKEEDVSVRMSDRVSSDGFLSFVM